MKVSDDFNSVWLHKTCALEIAREGDALCAQKLVTFAEDCVIVIPLNEARALLAFWCSTEDCLGRTWAVDIANSISSIERQLANVRCELNHRALGADRCVSK